MVLVSKKCVQAITTTAGVYQTRLDDDQKNPLPRNEPLMVSKVANIVGIVHRDYSTKEMGIYEAGLVEVEGIESELNIGFFETPTSVRIFTPRRTISRFLSVRTRRC